MVYKRCAKTESVSSQLVDHMKGISIHLNKEFGKMKLIVQEGLSKYVNYEKTAGGENKFSS